MIEAKANEQVTIEQIGGSLTMAGWLWTQAVSERARLSEENATLTQQLADAKAEIARLRAELAVAQRSSYAGWVAATGYPIADWVYEYEEHKWLKEYAAVSSGRNVIDPR